MIGQSTRPLMRVATTYEELFTLDGPNFIRCAYLTLLNRKVDPSGLASATRLLGRGGRKIDFLWSLARSPEGVCAAVKLPGLDIAFRNLALSRLPVVGRLLRASLRVEALGARHRQIRALAFHIEEVNAALLQALVAAEDRVDSTEAKRSLLQLEGDFRTRRSRDIETILRLAFS